MAWRLRREALVEGMLHLRGVGYAVTGLLLWCATVAPVCAASTDNPEKPAASAVTKAESSFDHFTTGFPLTGQHVFTPCETCHVDGVFKGVPRVCDGCHDGVTATGKTLKHIVTEEQCDVCHSTQGFGATAQMDHSVVTSACADCHNGVTATGKDAANGKVLAAGSATIAIVGHIASTDNCGSCHSVASWMPTITVDHREVLGSCASCHIKAKRHIAASEVCEACHNTQDWKAQVDHAETEGRCVDCHKLPKRHPATTDSCEACHNSIIWEFDTVDHAEVLDGSCSQCHGRRGELEKVRNARAQPLTHIAVADECDSCHSKMSSSFAAVVFDHAGIQGNCVSCHSEGGGALARPATHMPATTVCEACHKNFVSFKPVAAGDVDHTQTLGTCSSCHGGGFGTPKPASHVPTTLECDACHTVVTWLLGTVNHDTIFSGCFACHDGVIFSGKSPTHFTTSNECQLCHEKLPAKWTPVAAAAVDHSQVQGTCFSCHDGSKASGKPVSHINTTNTCDGCHEPGPAPWAPVAKSAVDHTQVLGTCESCHDGVIATGKIPNHIPVPTGQDCGSCHSTSVWKPAAVDHAGFVDNCVSCHDGVKASGKGPAHMPTSNQCQVCHDKFPTPWFPVAAARVDHREVVGPCGFCHDGKLASGKPAVGHINSTNRCEACHQAAPVPWAPVANNAVDHTEVIGVCSSCHNGTIATGKSANHVPTNQECGSCHSTSQWIPVVVDHTSFVDNCISCHNGNPISGKGLNHIASTDACQLCHDKSPAPWRPVAADRVDHNQTLGTCFSCHDGSKAQGKGATHAHTSDRCEACHAPGPAPWAPLPGLVDHTNDNVLPGFCNDCHGLPAPIQGATAPNQPPDHIPTTESCDLCHSIVSWLPAKKVHSVLTLTDNCVQCHTLGIRATPKPATHIPSSNVCEACHKNTIAWIPVPRGGVDHSQVIGSCSSCHDNVIATGKSATHFPTTLECDICHSTAAWIPATVDHSTFVGNCIQCHNGTKASGKSPAHIRSSDQCDKCHDKFPNRWVPVPVNRVDHGEVAGSCVSCHNGSVASGRSPSHIRTSDVCDACHQPGPASWAPLQPAAVDHTQVIGTCSSCHNGSVASGKSAAHVPTTQECNICHTTQAWKPATIDHTTITTDCLRCHNGVNASGKNATHIASSDLCERCHDKSPLPWKPVAANRVDHTQTLGTCSSCHNGVSATGKSATHMATTDECNVCHGTSSWLLSITGTPDHITFVNNCIGCHNGRIAVGKSARHITTTDVCDACHNKAPALWTPVPVNRVDHTQVLGTCVSCHNGSVASGKTPTHATTSDDCVKCHALGPVPWKPLPGLVDHTQVAPGKCNECHGLPVLAAATPPTQPADHIPTTASCDLCHLTTSWLPAQKVHSVLTITSNCVQCHTPGIRATVKPATHIPTSNVCEACHKNVIAWKPVLAADVDHRQVIGTCSSCHNGVTATGKSATHIATSAECDLCHGTTAWRPTIIPDHSTFAGNCFTCHNGTTASGKSSRHINTSNSCDSCHDKYPIKWTPVLANRVDHSQVVGTCFSCHNGSIASGKTASHINSSNNCDACHRPGPVPWKPVAAAAVDHTQVIGTCSSCHNGTVATGKSAGHIATTAECDLCHATSAWRPTIVPDHSSFVGNCFTCHNGTTASGKSARHINTSNTCDACHGKYPARWTPVAANRVDHTQVVGTCFSCHNGATASGKSASHINTSNNCDACHRPGPVPWAPVAANAVDHTQVIGTCSSCHNGTQARGKSAGHIPTTAECDLCHSTQAWTPTIVPDHTSFVGNCITCHNGTTASGKSARHINTTNLCDACHNKYPQRWTPVPANRVDHTQVLGACSSCHSKPGGHINTTDACDTCHASGPRPWVPVVTVDHAQVLGTCSSCHNGSTARGKGPTHVPTFDECDTCHNTSTWLGATVNHTNIFDGCVTCHNGVYATGKDATHLPTTDNCELCHNKEPSPWLPIRILNHNELLSQICSDCHSLPGGHCDTLGNLNCGDCHTAPTISPVTWLNGNFADCPPAPAPAPAPGGGGGAAPAPAPAPAMGMGGGAMGGGGMGGGGGGMGGGGGGGGGM